ncbi:hypothetical protein IFM89_004102 [Coptis chinensis]|uniref:Protein FAR1-RELATED SEQUENCE n=1 Tax=Coptis chinensis TaxID=261450 RepID=A0A835H1Q8_9MAGN|nr:hypothetical protein IFM89_004102 [Coptis chinensis]
MHSYFLKMQTENSEFFHTMDLDNEGRLRNVFWADGRCRVACKEFGDIITFDATYLTNKYDMPFAPFVGVNHHGQSVLLGCGLISREDTKTYEWLFKSWLACMHGCPPSAIITDQDRAMQNAIAIVFPNARHRLCLWHIMKKLPKKLRGYNEYESIKLCMQVAVYDSLTKEEFEENWCGFILKYDLESNEWLGGLYKERDRWVPALVKDSFWAGMSTTQRSESMNAFFDGYVNSKTILTQFVGQYENALRSKVEKENQAYFNSFKSRLPCISPYDMEKQFQGAYTMTKFLEFQEELRGKICCDLSTCKEDEEYEVNEDVPFGASLCRATFKVRFNGDLKEVDCNCQLFQFRGIVCRHFIMVLLHKKIYQVPDKYILRRWNKNIKRRHTKIKISYDKRSAKPESRRFDELCYAFEEVADMVVDCEDRYKELMVHVHTLKEKFSHDNGACGSAKPVSKKNTVSPAYGDGQNILTLLVVRVASLGPFKRKQTNLEKIVQRLNKGKKNMKTSPSKENAKKDFHSLNFEEGRNMLNASNAPAYDHLTIQESITSKGYAMQHWITEPIFEQPNTLQEFNNICNTIQLQKLRGFNTKNSAQPCKFR